MAITIAVFLAPDHRRLPERNELCLRLQTRTLLRARWTDSKSILLSLVFATLVSWCRLEPYPGVE